MRVLLVISDYQKGFPYIQDLEKELKKKNISVAILDVENLNFISRDGNTSKISDSRVLRRLLQIPKIRTYTRTLVLKRFLKELQGQFDAVGIHSCDYVYIPLIGALSKVSENLSVTIWGSDFYRVTAKMRRKKQRILDRCRYVVFGNPANAHDFISFYGKYGDKCLIVGFGVEKFEIIKMLLEVSTKEQIKYELQLPADRFILALGYNGSEAQQHVALIEQLSSLPEEIKSRLFLLLQMTYGNKQEYEQQVRRKADAAGIPYKLLNSFLNDEDTSKLRIATDLVLNAQITDGFSASLQEHIYANNIVIVGDWLRYKPLEQAAIFYLKSAMEDFAEHTRDAVSNYESYQKSIQHNPGRIYEMSSWTKKVQSWIDVYEGNPEKVSAYAYRE